MSFGLQIRDPSTGRLIYDTSSVAWNQVDMFLVPANHSVNRSYPSLQGRTLRATQVFINPPPTDRKALAHQIIISGTSVNVTGGTEDVYVMVIMQ